MNLKPTPRAANKRPLMAASQSAYVADKDVVKQHGQWRGPVMEESSPALPNAPVDGADAAISAWKADLCGETLGKRPWQETAQKYAPPVKDCSRS